MRNAYTHNRPNPKHAITFAVISALILFLPLFWSPLNSQPITPLAVYTPEPQVLPEGHQGPLQPAPPVTAADYPTEPTFEFSRHLRRMVLSLFGVTVLIAVTLKLLEKQLPGMAGRGRKRNSFMEVLARESMTPQHSLALVKVGGKFLLVGMCEQSMSTLCELSEADLADYLKPEETPDGQISPPPGQVYSNILKHYLSIVPGMGARK